MTCISLFLLVVDFGMDTLLLSVVNHVISSHHFFDQTNVAKSIILSWSFDIFYQKIRYCPNQSTHLSGFMV